jgi:hypothetical protein
MTRKDWWLGIIIILLALFIQTLVLLRVAHREDAKAKARPVSIATVLR